ncbi:hypothetical protein [Hymenobacter sp. DG01]|uniref:hypothetical protein n=1 Tax=Hymenobacter sp. DG01 TaxID=2584940 RepID=UPI00111CC019|nr:hypothetical protein [Hymenobacter sp. DG01]
MPSIAPASGPVNASVTVQIHDELWRVVTMPAFAPAEVLEARLLQCTAPDEAAALTILGGKQGASYLSAVLNAGWQEVNYLFIDGAWYFCPSLNPSERVPLIPVNAAPTDRATDAQLQFLNRITKSHHFDREREALREAGEAGTVEDCSLLLDWCKKEIELRKKAESGR